MSTVINFPGCTELLPNPDISPQQWAHLCHQWDRAYTALLQHTLAEKGRANAAELRLVEYQSKARNKRFWIF